MKKVIQKLGIMVLAIGVLSFVAVNTKKEIKTADSKVTWKGYKVTGSHEGTIDLKSGFLNFESEKLTGGEFIVDMTTISSTDLSGGYKDKLDGHLKSADFFGVEANPTSTLIFEEVAVKGENVYTVKAAFTLKGKTNPIVFDIAIEANKAKAFLKVDRTVYDIKYGSASFFDGLADKAINNEFDITVDLKF